MCAVPLIGTTVGWDSRGERCGTRHCLNSARPDLPLPPRGHLKMSQDNFPVFHNHPLALKLASEWKDCTVSLQVLHIHPNRLTAPLSNTVTFDIAPNNSCVKAQWVVSRFYTFALQHPTKEQNTSGRREVS